MVVFDLRSRNGLLVEYYVTFEEIMRVSKDQHDIHARLRSLSEVEMHSPEVLRDLARSARMFREAWSRVAKRLGPTSEQLEIQCEQFVKSLRIV